MCNFYLFDESTTDDQLIEKLNQMKERKNRKKGRKEEEEKHDGRDQILTLLTHGRSHTELDSCHFDWCIVHLMDFDYGWQAAPPSVGYAGALCKLKLGISN